MGTNNADNADNAVGCPSIKSEDGEDMIAFDKLPPEIRKVLADAKFNFSAIAVLWQMSPLVYPGEPWDAATAIKKIRATERKVERRVRQ